MDIIVILLLKEIDRYLCLFLYFDIVKYLYVFGMRLWLHPTSCKTISLFSMKSAGLSGTLERDCCFVRQLFIFPLTFNVVRIQAMLLLQNLHLVGCWTSSFILQRLQFFRQYRQKLLRVGYREDVGHFVNGRILIPCSGTCFMHTKSLIYSLHYYVVFSRSASNSAISRGRMLSSIFAPLTPSSNIGRQKGQLESN